jgi:hypothetical protein
MSTDLRTIYTSTPTRRRRRSIRFDLRLALVILAMAGLALLVSLRLAYA